MHVIGQIKVEIGGLGDVGRQCIPVGLVLAVQTTGDEQSRFNFNTQAWSKDLKPKIPEQRVVSLQQNYMFISISYEYIYL